MAERLRVVFISTGLATGGAEMMLLKLVQRLPAVGFECMVVSLRDAGSIGPRITSLGIPVETLELQRPWSAPPRILRLRTVLRQWQPDLLMGWMYHGNLAATLAGSGRWATPVAWSIRQTLDDPGAERRLTRLVIRAGARLAGKPEVIIYNSSVAASQHRAAGYHARREVVIPNGFDPEEFRPRPGAGAALRARLGIPGAAPLVGLLARYHRMKDHATFLRMAGRMVASGSPAHFVCAGSGVTPQNPELAEGIQAGSLAGRVHLLGEVRDTAELLAGLDLLCSTSRSGEGFSNVLGEAMACGVPCVVTDVGDSAMIVGSTGTVAAPGDADGLARGCAMLLAESPEARGRRSAAARQRVIAEFSIDRVAARYAELWRGLIEARRSLTLKQAVR